MNIREIASRASVLLCRQTTGALTDTEYAAALCCLIYAAPPLDPKCEHYIDAVLVPRLREITNRRVLIPY